MGYERWRVVQKAACNSSVTPYSMIKKLRLCVDRIRVGVNLLFAIWPTLFLVSFQGRLEIRIGPVLLRPRPGAVIIYVYAYVTYKDNPVLVLCGERSATKRTNGILIVVGLAKAYSRIR
jgi:hypothetical protein